MKVRSGGRLWPPARQARETRHPRRRAQCHRLVFADSGAIGW